MLSLDKDCYRLWIQCVYQFDHEGNGEVVILNLQQRQEAFTLIKILLTIYVCLDCFQTKTLFNFIWFVTNFRDLWAPETRCHFLCGKLGEDIIRYIHSFIHCIHAYNLIDRLLVG